MRAPLPEELIRHRFGKVAKGLQEALLEGGLQQHSGQRDVVPGGGACRGGARGPPGSDDGHRRGRHNQKGRVQSSRATNCRINGAGHRTPLVLD